jgi:tripartite-type tricarboxylate transporter receptor subunit TctC
MRKSQLLMPLTGLLAGLALAASDGRSAEVDYPHDTVTLVTHSSPGGGTDVFLREMVKYLGPIMGVDFVVENVRGGSGAKAMAFLATSPADGSAFYGTTPTFINTSILSDVEYTYEDLEPLVNVFFDPQIVYTRADSPFDSLAEVIDNAHQNPGQQKWGVSTPGSLDRQVMEKLKALTGTDPVIVTHEGGGNLLINVLNGTVDVGVGEIQELRGQIDAGEVKLLASYTAERLDTFPDLPTAREQGIDLVVDKFRGLAGPKGLPEDIIAAWETAIPALLEDPEFKKFYQESSLVPAFMPHDEYAQFIGKFAWNSTAPSGAAGRFVWPTSVPGRGADRSRPAR